ncbi:MAG: DUF1800 domain-containing protein, partial [Deltaproteobacteria bacterium]|nr:DUF1800 domain-containing protein [Deltaproteobacteria bacterium]
MNRDAWTAASRFGLGPQPGDLERITSDPRGWLLAQLAPVTEDVRWGAVAPSGGRLASLRTLNDLDEVAKKASIELAKAVYANDIGVRSEVLSRSDRPFLERWRMAWSNHFSVSIRKAALTTVAVPFEREAIAAHATGSFLDLLRAATLHPAMLLYLDNVKSIGPDSPAGRRKEKGLNENLARELLELHTLGVDGGYTQGDVEALAAVLTGWSLSRDPASSGTQFRAELHQPGSKKLLGKAIPEGGPDEIEAALRILAAHPSTARNVAVRLARHFAADDPPDKLVRALERSFRDSDGDLGSVARALVATDAAWEAPMAKLRTPQDLVLAVSRGFGPFRGEQQVQALRALGQVPFTAVSPAGWSDRAVDWAGSDQILARVDFAERLSSKLRTNPVTSAESLLGPVLSERTRVAVAGEARDRGLALLIACPEF